MKLLLNVVNRSSFRAPPGRTVRKVLEAAIAVGGLGRTRGRVLVELAWVDSPEMRRLNLRHRGERNSTDVLSFTDREPDPETGAVRLGEIVANLQEARRQARRRGLAVSAEAALYAAHGLLHILGMSDEDEAARAEMRRAERVCLRRARIRHPGVC